MLEQSGFVDIQIGPPVDTFGGADGESKARLFEVFGYAFLAHKLGARSLLGRAFSYPCVPKAGAPPGIRAALAEVRARARMHRHKNAFRSATPHFRRSKLTRIGRKTRAAFFPA
jgi:hypothetical protein